MPLKTIKVIVIVMFQNGVLRQKKKQLMIVYTIFLKYVRAKFFFM